MAFYQKLDATTKSQFGIGYDKVVLDTGAVISPWVWTFPATPGTTGYILQTDGTGTLSWVQPPAAADQTPYYLPVGETFKVFMNKQVLFSREIEVDGELEVDGDLIQVDGGAAVDIMDGVMPYLIEAFESYRIPVKKQGLFAVPIEVDGTLTVDGILVGV